MLSRAKLSLVRDSNSSRASRTLSLRELKLNNQKDPPLSLGVGEHLLLLAAHHHRKEEHRNLEGRYRLKAQHRAP